MGIVKSVQDLIAAIVELFGSIFSTILSAFESVFRLFATLLKDVVGLFEGFIRFLLSNIVPIAVVVGAFVAYSAYRRNQGRPVVADRAKRTT